MYYCVSYDISSNRLRLKVVRWCKKAGLVRLQRSVFIGPSKRTLIEDLRQEVMAVLPATDRFVIISLDNDIWQNVIIAGDTAHLKKLTHRTPVWHF
jgi:CRISPR-associated endonuclease Cas2